MHDEMKSMQLSALGNAVNAAKSLEGLRDALLAFEYARTDDTITSEYFDTYALPRFGGIGPKNLHCVWSWSPTHVLAGSGVDIRIEKRTDDESAGRRLVSDQVAACVDAANDCLPPSHPYYQLAQANSCLVQALCLSLAEIREAMVGPHSMNLNIDGINDALERMAKRMGV